MDKSVDNLHGILRLGSALSALTGVKIRGYHVSQEHCSYTCVDLWLMQSWHVYICSGFSHGFHVASVMLLWAVSRCGLICRDTNASLMGCQLTWPPSPLLTLSVPLPCSAVSPCSSHYYSILCLLSISFPPTPPSITVFPAAFLHSYPIKWILPMRDMINRLRFTGYFESQFYLLSTSMWTPPFNSSSARTAGGNPPGHLPLCLIQNKDTGD